MFGVGARSMRIQRWLAQAGLLFFTPCVFLGLSRPPANGRWNRLFAWDEGCGGKHAGKIDADGGCCETGGLARAVEIGAARRSGPGTGDPRPAPRQALLTLEGRRAAEIAAV